MTRAIAALLVLAAPLAAAQETDPALLARARAILEQAPLIDTHNDLPSMLVDRKGGDLAGLDLGVVQPELCADIPRLREGGVGAQYWSVYTDSGNMKTNRSLHEALREFDVVLRLVRSRPELELARTADDIERIHRSGRIASLIGVEGGHMIEGSLAVLRVFHELGARYLTLTHWDTVEWADAATDRNEHEGLTEFGESVVRELNRLGMFVDLSHVSAETMRDALRVSRAPVIFSHSNARAIDPHVRNVPDDVLRLLPKNGGVVHVNFINAFVSPADPEWQGRRKAALEDLQARLDDQKAVDAGIADWEKANPHPGGTIAEVADHIDHIRKVAGIDHVGIGADFYDAGATSMVPGLKDVSRYPYLFAELLRRGYSDDDLLKIAGRNHLRAMRQMEKTALALGAAPEEPRSGAPARVLIRTDRGDIVMEVDTARAPATAANFLRYVDGGFYDGGRFHRTVRLSNQPDQSVKIEVIQAGVNPSREHDGFPPIALERTSVTGLRHLDGVVSMARDGPDTATSDFFICIGDQPALDQGGQRNPDGQGFGAFGRVVDGMDVVRTIQASPADGQHLTPPVVIRSARRVR
jgi:membrane dipeptidase